MRRFFAVISLGIFIVILFLYMGNKMSENNRVEPETQYEKIMKIDLKNNYPETIDEVMTVNNEIIKYLYGIQEQKNEKENEEQMKSLISKQMELWDDELLEVNTSEQGVLKISEEIEKYKNNDILITNYKMTSPEEIKRPEGSRKIEKIKVLFYTNSDKNIFIQYGLRKTGNRWKIMGWNNAKKFVTLEEE